MLANVLSGVSVAIHLKRSSSQNSTFPALKNSTLPSGLLLTARKFLYSGHHACIASARSAANIANISYKSLPDMCHAHHACVLTEVIQYTEGHASMRAYVLQLRHESMQMLHICPIGRSGLDMYVASHLKSSSPQDSGFIIQRVFDGTQTISVSILDLCQGVVCWSLQQYGT